jgi:hypothetical protein
VLPVSPLRCLVVAGLVVSLLAGCRPAGSVEPSPAGSPVETVERAVALVEAKRFATLGDLACAARAAEVRTRFDPTPDIAAGLPPELTVEAALSALVVDVAPIEIRESFRLGRLATVRLEAIVRISIDRQRARELVDAVARERGVTLPPGVAAAAVDAFSAAATSRRDLAEDLPLRAEDGAWRFCW